VNCQCRCQEISEIYKIWRMQSPQTQRTPMTSREGRGFKLITAQRGCLVNTRRSTTHHMITKTNQSGILITIIDIKTDKRYGSGNE